MRREASAALGLEHVIAEHVLLRDRPVGRDLLRIDVLVDRRPGFAGARDLVAVLRTEPIHEAVIVVVEESVVVVVVVARRDEVDLLERNVLVTTRTRG